MLKTRLLLILIAFSLFAGKKGSAQGEFAPVGAEWWYHAYFSKFNEVLNITVNTHLIFHAISAKDTTILGVECRKMEIYTTEKSSNDIGAWNVSYGDPFYFYDNTDTVFVYNRNFNKFTPIYILNAHEGDTICLPVPPSPNPDLRRNPISGDTSFCFVIEKVALELYDTSYLKTFYTRALIEVDHQGTKFPAYNWTQAWWLDEQTGNGGKYIERIIGNLLPFQVMTWKDSDPYEYIYAPYGDLRCYNDSRGNIQLSTVSCDSLPALPSSVVSIHGNAFQANIYPNPAYDKVNIRFSQPIDAPLNATLYDLSGRMLKMKTIGANESKSEIGIVDLHTGFYILKLDNGNNARYFKFTILH